MTEMTEQLTYQTIGPAYITLGVTVKTEQKYEWLRKLNEIEHIHASPRDQLVIGEGDKTVVDFTTLLVMVSTVHKSHTMSGEFFIRDMLKSIGLEEAELTP